MPGIPGPVDTSLQSLLSLQVQPGLAVGGGQYPAPSSVTVLQVLSLERRVGGETPSRGR